MTGIGYEGRAAANDQRQCYQRRNAHTTAQVRPNPELCSVKRCKKINLTNGKLAIQPWEFVNAASSRKWELKMHGEEEGWRGGNKGWLDKWNERGKMIRGGKDEPGNNGDPTKRNGASRDKNTNDNDKTQ